MLIGQYESRISDKHQIAFPKRFRDVLGEQLVITKGLEEYIIIVSEKNWGTLLEGTQGKPFTNKSARSVQRFLLGNAAEVILDSKGRFVLPEFLRLYAHINTEVIFAGIDRFVELWDKKSWTEQQDRLGREVETIAGKLSENEAAKGDRQ